MTKSFTPSNELLPQKLQKKSLNSFYSRLLIKKWNKCNASAQDSQPQRISDLEIDYFLEEIPAYIYPPGRRMDGLNNTSSQEKKLSYFANSGQVKSRQSCAPKSHEGSKRILINIMEDAAKDSRRSSQKPSRIRWEQEYRFKFPSC